MAKSRYEEEKLKHEDKLRHVGRAHTDNHIRIGWMFGIIAILVLAAIIILLLSNSNNLKIPNSNNDTACSNMGGICLTQQSCSLSGGNSTAVKCSIEGQYCCLPVK